MARGRKPVGDKAMTAAERQQRRRNKLRAALPPFGSEDRFRLELYWWVQQQAWFYSNLDAGAVCRALEELELAFRMDVFQQVERKRDKYTCSWRADYLYREGMFAAGDGDYPAHRTRVLGASIAGLKKLDDEWWCSPPEQTGTEAVKSDRRFDNQGDFLKQDQ